MRLLWAFVTQLLISYASQGFYSDKLVLLICLQSLFKHSDCLV